MHLLQRLENSHLSEVYNISKQTPWGASWSLEKLNSELTHGKGLVSIDDQTGLVSGFILYRELTSNTDSQAGRVIEIVWLATAPVFLHQGVMKSLFQHLFGAYGQNSEFWLEVSENNHIAIQFYEKLGFIKTGRRPHYYSDLSAAINMNKKIT
jgi:ribosomal protein S18 acetylase RimI-like enzyme